MKGDRIKEIFENWSKIRIAWKIEIWKLEFQKLPLRIGILKIIWELEFWKLNLKEIGILKMIWESEFWKLNYELEFWILFEDGILKTNK